MQITFIGGGNMASAIISGLAKQGGHRISVVEPSADKRNQLEQAYGVTALEQPPQHLSADDVVVLAVKPQQLKDVCLALAPVLGNALVVSIAAGVGIAALARWLGSGRIVRVMPNTPAMVGKGVSGLFAPLGLAEGDRNNAAAIMAAVGKVFWLENESGIDDITAVSGSGPAYVFYFIESMIAAARELGFDDATARQLVLGTFDGAVELAKQSDLDVATLRANVTSKGGTTERAVARFEADGIKAAIQAGMQDCRARSVELGQLLSQD
ncbi:pyrroline-5-carboxylate reductase [Pseudogulbenkiania sp. NH8B]|uniref:pyrroline-5-carboxylate reductase n=1 Tax=Pseudogulbenkiania sp. (strain NH8B) TaxID=748280 RepID=UPI000227A43A|nr:pyrroline-5-carboxylate reductase [Pseudogulbenkiania sp. NH8B]BAK78740.1 pyrroline-5-carboxylate reductase [Pseudogulbenkiania sp. NH8B]